jgi:hypothetical protein
LLPSSKNQTEARPATQAGLRGYGPLSVRIVALLLATLLCTSSSVAYSVLTHEEIVDLVWTSELRPLLLQRFPDLTEEQNGTGPPPSRKCGSCTRGAGRTLRNVHARTNNARRETGLSRSLQSRFFRRISDGANGWCRGPESNWLRPPFQGGALPMSYPGNVTFSSLVAALSRVNSLKTPPILC